MMGMTETFTQARDEAHTIDHLYVKRLVTAGMEEEVAEVVAENHALQGAASAQQLAETEANLRIALAQIEANSNARMNQMEINSNEKMKQMEINLQKDMKQIEANLRKEMAQMETRLTNRMVAGFLAIAGFMLSLFIFFFRQ